MARAHHARSTLRRWWRHARDQAAVVESKVVTFTRTRRVRRARAVHGAWRSWTHATCFKRRSDSARGMRALASHANRRRTRREHIERGRSKHHHIVAVDALRRWHVVATYHRCFPSVRDMRMHTMGRALRLWRRRVPAIKRASSRLIQSVSHHVAHLLASHFQEMTTASWLEQLLAFCPLSLL